MRGQEENEMTEEKELNEKLARWLGLKGQRAYMALGNIPRM